MRLSSYAVALVWHIQNEEEPDWGQHITSHWADVYDLHTKLPQPLQSWPLQDQLILAQLILLSEHAFPYWLFFNPLEAQDDCIPE